MAVNVSKGALHPQGCMFCRRHDGGFSSREHVFPESLDNTTVILPPGVVCDRCNNGPLAAAEQEFIRFPGIAAMRVVLGHTNKKGARPTARWANATFSSPAEHEIFVVGDDKKAFEIVSRDGPLVHGRLNFTSGGVISTARYRKMTRAIWKAVLECVYLDHGEMVFQARFDDVRAMTIGARPASGFLLFTKDMGPPTTEVSLTYRFMESDAGPVLPAQVVVGGLVMFTELFVREFRGDRAEAEKILNVVEF